MIRDRRRELGLSQVTLAADTGIDQYLISRAETGKQLTLNTALALAARLGLAVEDIATVADVPEPRDGETHSAAAGAA